MLYLIMNRTGLKGLWQGIFYYLMLHRAPCGCLTDPPYNRLQSALSRAMFKTLLIPPAGQRII